MRKQIIMADLFKPVPTDFEPKRNNRFVVEFPESIGIEPYFIRSISRPKLIGGKWQEIQLVIMDVIQISASSAIMKMVDFCNKQKPGFFSKKRNLFSFTIKALDPCGVEVETWMIDIKEVLSVDFGNYDYREDNLQTVSVVLKPSDCRLG